ncbi:Uncharacterised protein [Vibrio cholerae]|nr:Uncharacterised protein [Vibrio cholerae]CSI72130.1 Uncharacterised protein [Vibrio cholerae]
MLMTRVEHLATFIFIRRSHDQHVGNAAHVA